MIQFCLGILITILTFHVNHKVKRIFDIKILINTLFDVFGTIDSFLFNNKKEVSNQLMNEILNVEKMHDNNFYVKNQINKLKELKKLYVNDEMTIEEFEEHLANINFKKLGRTFIILAILNLNPDFITINLKK
jgi:hypothetical protein